ncbi:MAG: hypothetical protein IPO77_12735 [Acidobacteria bacterium]|nr:hypothetical protein [Acidobacteriota bacterium]
MPVPSRNFQGLTAGKENIIYIFEQLPAGAGGPTGPPGITLHKFDLTKRKLDKVMDGITAFEVSANGEKALYRQGFGGWFIASTATLGAPAGPMGPGGPGATALKTADMEVSIDPKGRVEADVQ